MDNAKVKDSVCDTCARRMGYEPEDRTSGVWIGTCDWCGERMPLTSLYDDWRKKGESDGK